MPVRNNDPETDTQHELGRQQTRKVKKWRAQQRLVGSSILGGIAAWKLLTYEPVNADGIPWILGVWIVLALIAFGLASFDQVLKAVKR